MLDMEGRESPFQNLTKHIGMDIHAPTCPFSLGPSVHGPQVEKFLLHIELGPTESIENEAELSSQTPFPFQQAKPGNRGGSDQSGDGHPEDSGITI